MCDAPLINNGATKSEDGSVSYSNSSNFISHQQANKITTVNSEGNNNNNNNSNFNEQFDISRSSVTTPGSEIELNLQNFTLKQQQQDLTSHYTTSNSNIASRVQSLSVNNTNSKINTSVNSNAPSAIDATNSIRRLSISTASPHKPLNNANEMYYQNIPHNTGSFLAPPAIPSLYVLKIQNVPSDLTARESHILFALMADCSPRSIEVLVDGSEKFIKATLPDLKVAIQTAIILDSKKICLVHTSHLNLLFNYLIIKICNKFHLMIHLLVLKQVNLFLIVQVLIECHLLIHLTQMNLKSITLVLETFGLTTDNQLLLALQLLQAPTILFQEITTLS